ncbi:MAG: G5 domain-containing protein [Syntrophomonas sp.]|nr:G5 domain-containing protein [Syntrophomonas sp.]
MADGKKTIARVISLVMVAAIITILLSSLALAARDERIYPSNISVDGIAIANQTRQEALRSLEGGMNKWEGVLRLKINSTGEIISIPIKDSGISYDLDRTLVKVDDIVDNSQVVDSLWKNAMIRGKAINVKPILRLDDKELLYSRMLDIKQRTDKPAIDARVLYNDGLLEYISHEKGSAMDISVAVKEISDALSEGDLGPVSLTVNELSPNVKNEDIKNVKELIGVYISQLDRNSTIKRDLQLFTTLLNGTIVIPGDTFSMVKTLNQKVIQSPAIYTLAEAIYQACLNAHIQVVDRPARTAASKDVKFVNNLGNPVLLHLAIEENKLLVKIYGCQTEAGREISLIREQTVLTPEIVEKVSLRLKPQERIVQQEGKNGIQLKTYRLVKENGKEVAKELLAEETYPALNTIILTAPSSIIK